MREREEADKREHSTKPEVDDLTDYQSLNSLGRAGVAGEAKETPASGSPEEVRTTSDQSEPATEIEYSNNYNDGADFNTVDNKGETNT
jgi:hypothetical protein